MVYFIYILRCRDGSLYTGVTSDLEKRMEQHARGKGSRYVASRLPFSIVHAEETRTRSDALKRESEIKAFTRQEKLALVENSAADMGTRGVSPDYPRSKH